MHASPREQPFKLLHGIQSHVNNHSPPRPTALPGALPVAPASSPAAPCHRPATTETSVSDISAPWPASPPDRDARLRPSQPFDLLCVAGRRAPWAVASGCIRLDTVRRIKNSFFNLFNPRNISKLPKFVETCKNVQK
jgi:hypothetical protein